MARPSDDHRDTDTSFAEHVLVAAKWRVVGIRVYRAAIVGHENYNRILMLPPPHYFNEIAYGESLTETPDIA